jgi:hypothetical protein
MAYLREQARPPSHHARLMRRTWLSPIWIAALVLVGALGYGTVRVGPHVATVVSTLGIAADRPLYSVTELQWQLAHHPQGWIGRAVLVQGSAGSYHTWSPPDSIVLRITLRDPGAPPGTLSLPLAWGNPDPLRASLRHLPLIGRLAPQPQVVRWGTLTTYRVRLRAAPAGGSCSFLPCFEAVLLDAAP